MSETMGNGWTCPQCYAHVLFNTTHPCSGTSSIRIAPPDYLGSSTVKVPPEIVAKIRNEALESAAKAIAIMPRWCSCDDGGQGGCIHDAAVNHIVDFIRALKEGG